MWKLRTRSLILGERTLMMGVLNLTPDSFSDGGEFLTVDAALTQALAMLDQGADIVDVGGESTRPGAGAGTPDAISADAEQQRILPLIHALRKARPDTVISVDTYRAGTARAAIAAGAEIVNDVSGMQWDPRMADTCAELGCGVIAMHTRGLPSQWKDLPPLGSSLLPTVLAGLRASASQLMLAGCERRSIVLDPGIGFGKRGEENWTLLRELDHLRQLGFPLLVGLSRKGFLRTSVSRATDDPDPSRAALDAASATANAVAALAGAHILRVHDPVHSRVAVAVADAVRASS